MSTTDTIETLRAENKALRELAVGEAAKSAAARHGANVDLLAPAIEALSSVRVKDGKAHVYVRDAQGNPRIADARGTPMAPDHLVAEMRRNPAYALAFNDDASNDGSPQKIQSFAKGGVITRAAFDAMSPIDRMNTMKAGTQLRD